MVNEESASSERPTEPLSKTQIDARPISPTPATTNDESAPMKHPCVEMSLKAQQEADPVRQSQAHDEASTPPLVKSKKGGTSGTKPGEVVMTLGQSQGMKARTTRRTAGAKSVTNPPSSTSNEVPRSTDIERTRLDGGLIDKLLQIVLELKDRGEAFAFLKPVDPVALKIPHYFQVIKHPMDFETIEKKLGDSVPGSERGGDERPRYEYLEEFEADVQLMFSNSATFNGEAHPLTKNGRIVEAVFKSEMRKLKRSIGLSESVLQRSDVARMTSFSPQSIASASTSSSRKRQRTESSQQQQPSDDSATRLGHAKSPVAPVKRTQTPISVILSQEKRRKSTELSRSQSPATPSATKETEALKNGHRSDQDLAPILGASQSVLDTPPNAPMAVDEECAEGEDTSQKAPAQVVRGCAQFRFGDS